MVNAARSRKSASASPVHCTEPSIYLAMPERPCHVLFVPRPNAQRPALKNKMMQFRGLAFCEEFNLQPNQKENG